MDRAKINIRNFESDNDMKLQYNFWNSVTAHLPWAWKPTKSPTLFHDQVEFDPRTRCFAFKGNKLVGYMSFTGMGSFISLGYPWALGEYGEELQEEMYEMIYGFASSEEYGGKTFAQRFRSQWTDQINFFLSKGFNITSRTPIYGLFLNQLKEHPYSNHNVEIVDNFQMDVFAAVAKKSGLYNNEDLAMLANYFKAVVFDFSVQSFNEEGLTGYFGVAIRQDTQYAEIITCAMEDSVSEEAFQSCLNETIKKLKAGGTKVVSITEDLIPTEALLEIYGFQKISESIMMMKSI